MSMTYIVIVEDGADQLMIEVNRRIESDGCKPIGGVCFSMTEGGLLWSQAMIKE